MSPESIVKSQARQALRHNYPAAVTALVAAVLPIVLIDSIGSIVAGLAFGIIKDENIATVLAYAIAYPLILTAAVLISPVINGYIRAYYLNGYTKKLDLNDLFYYFENGRYFSTLALNLMYAVRMLLPSLLLFSPVIIYEIILSNNGGDFYGSVLYYDFYFILCVLSTITTVLYSLKYFTVFTLNIEMESLSNKDLLRYSKAIMKNKTTSTAKLIFSFTPWMLLCLTILPMLYVIPYMTQSLCIAAKWMTKASPEVTKP